MRAVETDTAMDEQTGPPVMTLMRSATTTINGQGPTTEPSKRLRGQASLGATARGWRCGPWWSCKRQGLILSIRVNLPGWNCLQSEGAAICGSVVLIEASECAERRTPINELLLPSNLATIPRRSGRIPGVLTVMISAAPRTSHPDIFQPRRREGKNRQRAYVFCNCRRCLTTKVAIGYALRMRLGDRINAQYAEQHRSCRPGTMLQPFCKAPAINAPA